MLRAAGPVTTSLIVYPYTFMGARAKTRCLLIHAEASPSLYPYRFATSSSKSSSHRFIVYPYTLAASSSRTLHGVPFSASRYVVSSLEHVTMTSKLLKLSQRENWWGGPGERFKTLKDEFRAKKGGN